MTPAARYAAAIEILDAILEGEATEPVLARWGRQNRFAGSKDRAAIRDHVFDVLRAKRSLAAYGGAMDGRGLVLGLMRRDGPAPEQIFGADRHAPRPLTEGERAHLQREVTLSPGEALDLPDWLIPLWSVALGADAGSIAALGRERGPVTLRVNLAKAEKAAAIAALEADGIGVRSLPDVDTALIVDRNPRRVQRSAAYLGGLVELQDASSQLAVMALPLNRGDRVLDYCAGGGGKALALWDRTRAALTAHDADPRRMVDLPARAARAGATIELVDAAALRERAPFDLVLCDAPCSGSGTWRRTPMAKWEFTSERLGELNDLQDSILDKAAPLVRPGGTLAYATCSVFLEENDAVVARFLDDHGDWSSGEPLRVRPAPDRDGFFLCLLTRKT